MRALPSAMQRLRIGARTSFAHSPATIDIAAVTMKTRSQLPPADSAEAKGTNNDAVHLGGVKRAGIRGRILDAEGIGAKCREDRKNLTPEQKHQRSKQHEGIGVVAKVHQAQQRP